MLDYLFVNNHIEAFTALKQSAGIDYTPDPNARYTGLLEKKWTSVIRLQKKVNLFIPYRITNQVILNNDGMRA